MLKERTGSTECREAVLRLVAVLQAGNDLEEAVEGELVDLSDEATAWAAAAYLNQAARESLRTVVRATEIAAQKRLDSIRGLNVDRATSTIEVRFERDEDNELTLDEVKAWLRTIGLRPDEEDFDLRLTETFLDSRFTLRNGDYVSWGDATIAQHKERIAMFSDMVKSGIEGMARHAKAIDLIRSHGVTTLRDVRQ